MKKNYILIVYILFVSVLSAQVGINTRTPHPSAILEVNSSSKGFLPPRLTGEQRDAINSPAAGLMLFNITEECLQVNNGDSTNPDWYCLGEIASAETIPLPQIPPSIEIKQNLRKIMASIFDNDYLPYSNAAQPNGDGATDSVDADGTADTPLDFQGTLTETGLTIRIPVTTTGDGILPSYSSTVTVPAELTEDNISREVTLNWEEQDFIEGDTSITATLKAEGGPLNIKKLDLNRGLGDTSTGILLASFTYPYNNNGDVSDFSFRAVPAHIDRNIESPTHQFIYMPVTSPTGKTWLNNNLGAAYANINSSVFNPLQQATAFNDENAYGGYYNFGRFSDGHEFSDSPMQTTQFPTNRPNSNISVRNRAFWSDNNQPQTLESLWQNEDSQNNPCPIGFRVPNGEELEEEEMVWTPNNREGAFNSPLKLTTNGFRVNETRINFIGSYGYYWSTQKQANNVYRAWGFNVSGAKVQGRNVAYPIGVRCIED